MKFIKRFLITIISIFVIVFLVGFGVSAYSTMTRPVKYVDLVNTYAKEYNVDPLLVMSVIKVESNFDPSVKSKAGALGLMQLMPDTAESINKMRNTHFTVEDLKNLIRTSKWELLICPICCIISKTTTWLLQLTMVELAM